ncbi:MAG: phosphate transport system protein [Flavobacterium sp.]|jgi:phosphate transport system protein
MSLHLQRDLVQIKKEILQLGNMVEVAINNAILSLIDRRPELAESVIKNEKFINQKEVLIEENCLKILALHQPVAVDLRFIVVILKVNNDLERMGDFAVNAAKRAISLSKQAPIPYPPEFTNTMSKGIITMVHDSLDALVKLDVNIARKVIAMDDDIDEVNRLMYVELQSLMEKDSSTINRAVELLSTSRYLERIADLATNIAEEIIFIVEGEIVRHHLGTNY